MRNGCGGRLLRLQHGGGGAGRPNLQRVQRDSTWGSLGGRGTPSAATTATPASCDGLDDGNGMACELDGDGEGNWCKVDGGDCKFTPAIGLGECYCDCSTAAGGQGGPTCSEAPPSSGTEDGQPCQNGGTQSRATTATPASGNGLDAAP